MNSLFNENRMDVFRLLRFTSRVEKINDQTDFLRCSKVRIGDIGLARLRANSSEFCFWRESSSISVSRSAKVPGLGSSFSFMITIVCCDSIVLLHALFCTYLFVCLLNTGVLKNECCPDSFTGLLMLWFTVRHDFCTCWLEFAEKLDSTDD